MEDGGGVVHPSFRDISPFDRRDDYHFTFDQLAPHKAMKPSTGTPPRVTPETDGVKHTSRRRGSPADSSGGSIYLEKDAPVNQKRKHQGEQGGWRLKRLRTLTNLRHQGERGRWRLKRLRTSTNLISLEEGDTGHRRSSADPKSPEDCDLACPGTLTRPTTGDFTMHSPPRLIQPMKGVRETLPLVSPGNKDSNGVRQLLFGTQRPISKAAKSISSQVSLVDRGASQVPRNHSSPLKGEGAAGEEEGPDALSNLSTPNQPLIAKSSTEDMRGGCGREDNRPGTTDEHTDASASKAEQLLQLKSNKTEAVEREPTTMGLRPEASERSHPLVSMTTTTNKIVETNSEHAPLMQLPASETHSSRPLTLSEAAAVQGSVGLAMQLFPELSTDLEIRHRMTALAEEAYKLADEVYTMEDAEAWGESFTFPSETVERDLHDYLASGSSLQTLAAQRLEAVGKDRLSSHRAPLSEVMSNDNPELELLQKLADEGMSLQVDPAFVANSSIGVKPDLRQKYLATKSAVNKLLYTNFVQKGLAIILPVSALEKGKDKESYHISPLSWAPKSGTPKGRPIGDCSDGGKGALPLNSKHTKEACDSTWGKIRHPTIGDMATTVHKFLANAPPPILGVDPGERIVVWKMDLKGAYTLLSFCAKDVPLVGMELADGLVMFFLCGVFGWTGTPACFQVVTRAILYELRLHLTGRVEMYVDDIFGASKVKDLTRDLEMTRSICVRILGSDSVADEKTESGPRLTVIGYDIDAARGLVTVARKNVLRALHGFLSTDVSAPTTVKHLQKLASWASRYGEICRYMQPFVRALYSAYSGRRTTGAIPLTPAARISILVFRVLLSLSTVLEVRFARTLASFVDHHPPWIVEFDASLSGIGILWFYRENSESTEVLLGGCSLDITALGFGSDASYQNTAEFIAAAFGVRGLSAFSGARKASIEFRGDSISALTWARKRKVRSPLASNASVFFALQCMALEVEISTVTHLAAADNWRADMLSRGHCLADLEHLDGRFNRTLPVVDLQASRVLELCDPSVDHTASEEGFLQFWTKVQTVVRDRIVLTRQ